MSHLDEIRAKLPIEDVVGQYVSLKKAGRNLKGLCPFHNDSRPSFTVSPEKGIAYCFSCNTGGDIFKFTQLVEKTDFPGALKLLADRAGVRLPEFRPEIQDEKRQILKANEEAAAFFSSQLKLFVSGMEYVKSRGLSEETIKLFQLGFSPDSYTALRDHFQKAGFSEKLLLNAGLISQRSMADRNTYDRFRGRVMFPIADVQGNIIGFGGRIMDEGEPKYLNSPETEVYHKGRVLYGLHLAKEFIKKEDLAIFVEGYMDVITAHQAGFRNVIATSGTALTADQLTLIQRFTNNIAFCLDSDAAGQRATGFAKEVLANVNDLLLKKKKSDGNTYGPLLNIKVIKLPEGKDPDECIRGNPNAWVEAVAHPISIMDFYFDHAFSLHDRGELEGKKAILAILLPLIKELPSSMEQNDYLERLASELKTEAKYLWDDMKKIGNRRIYPSRPEVISAPKKEVFSREEFLLGFIVNQPALYELVYSNLIDTASFDPASEKIYKTLKRVYSSRSVIDIDEIKAELSPDEVERLNILPLLIEEHYPDFSEESAKKEVISLIRSINRTNLHRSQKEFEVRIKASKDTEERSLLLNQYTQILKLYNHV